MIPERIDVLCAPVQVPQQCRAVAGVLSRVGDKWAVLIIAQLRSGPLRFTELKRAIRTVSQRMLTLTLRGLERDGLVSRHVTPTIPPRVDYALTELGQSLRPIVETLAEWALTNHLLINEAQLRYDRVDDLRI